MPLCAYPTTTRGKKVPVKLTISRDGPIKSTKIRQMKKWWKRTSRLYLLPDAVIYNRCSLLVFLLRHFFIHVAG